MIRVYCSTSDNMYYVNWGDHPGGCMGGDGGSV